MKNAEIVKITPKNFYFFDGPFKDVFYSPKEASIFTLSTVLILQDFMAIY